MTLRNILSAAGFAVWAATLVLVGVFTGVSAAEFIPTAIVEGLVIGGLILVAYMPPDAAAPGDDEGERHPESPAPPLDPNVWAPLFSGQASEAPRYQTAGAPSTDAT
ncbi:MAG TPA: hypothetical protein VEY89_14515 [Candidatus Dormibacteraeota bacterium]|nr:hypothetical protein [Candidatus Dormibacteraeota bacterium]